MYCSTVICLSVCLSVCVSSSCDPVREVIMRQTEKWQWSVTWLKKKVNKCTHTRTHVHTHNMASYVVTMKAGNTTKSSTSLFISSTSEK